MAVEESGTASDPDNQKSLAIGDFVKLDRAVGEVRYIGSVDGYAGEWVGVDWLNGTRGKHDGTVKGRKYFNTRLPTSGSLVRASKLEKGNDLLSEITRKYAECSGEIDLKIGVKAVETYLSNASEKQKIFQLLDVVAIDYGCVNRTSPNLMVFKRCRELNLYGNILSKWSTVLDILQSFPAVRFLNLGMNYFIYDEQFGEDKREVTAPVHHLVMNKCQLTEYMVDTILRTFPFIRELHLHETGLTRFTVNASILKNIKILSLEDNALESFENAPSLSEMPNLTTLNLTGCRIRSVDFGAIVGFPNLTNLSLSSNPIQKWSSISELARLPALTTLNIDHLPTEASREMIIAKLPRLKHLNHSEVTSVERRSSEITFLNKCGRGVVSEEHAADITRLKEMYGDPDKAVRDPHEMKLLSLKLCYKDKCVERSFPRNTAIPKLVAISSRLLRFPPTKVSVQALSPDGLTMSVDPELNRDLNFYSISNGFTCAFSR
uniref:Tubulin-specific chaperone E n=1 Tax=Steinernema glaseri TaxID=37863 RepID=A0A1I7ZAT0_9BILA